MKKRNTTYRLNIVDYLIFIICSLAAAAALIFFYRDLNSYTIKQAEAPVAKIYFKKNTAQRKFVDNDIWEVLTNSSDIYDGDRIRTSKDSEAYTEFNDSGIQIQLREKSMVQIFKNKKLRSVDFIGGEIFVATTKPEEKIVIHSGKNEISIGQVSEVKLALPEVSPAVASGEEEAVEESPVVIEVISGQVEVIEQTAPAKNKEEKKEEQPIVLSAGQSITLIPQVEEKAPLVEEPVKAAEEVAEIAEAIEPEAEVEVEIEAEPAPEAATEALVEEVVENKVEAVVEKKPEPVAAKKAEPVVEKKPEPVVENKPAVPEVVKLGVEKTIVRPTKTFVKQVYDPSSGKYNYHHDFALSEIAGKNVKIPAGALVEFSISGTTDKDLNRFVIQISTGEEEWHQAHAFIESCPNNGAGMKMGQPFEVMTTLKINREIVNSDRAGVNLSYEPRILDESVTFSDLQIHFRVVSVDASSSIKPIASGYKKTIEYQNLTLPKNQWGQRANDYDYRIQLTAESIFGALKSVPKDTKIKITVSGKCDSQIAWMGPELVHAVDEWIQLLNTDGDAYKLRFNQNDAIQRNRQFSYSRSLKTVRDLPDTLEGLFSLIASSEGLRKEPSFENLTITFEVE